MLRNQQAAPKDGENGKGEESGNDNIRHNGIDSANSAGELDEDDSDRGEMLGEIPGEAHFTDIEEADNFDNMYEADVPEAEDTRRREEGYVDDDDYQGVMEDEGDTDPNKDNDDSNHIDGAENSERTRACRDA